MPSKANRLRPPGYAAAAKHQRENQASRSEERGRKWYQTPTWKKLRREHLAEHPYCVACRAEGKPLGLCQAKIVDHIEPHRGNWSRFIDPTNLQTLCGTHHSRKTAAEDGGFGNKPQGGPDF